MRFILERSHINANCQVLSPGDSQRLSNNFVECRILVKKKYNQIYRWFMTECLFIWTHKQAVRNSNSHKNNSNCHKKFSCVSCQSHNSSVKKSRMSWLIYMTYYLVLSDSFLVYSHKAMISCYSDRILVILPKANNSIRFSRVFDGLYD